MRLREKPQNYAALQNKRDMNTATELGNTRNVIHTTKNVNENKCQTRAFRGSISPHRKTRKIAKTTGTRIDYSVRDGNALLYPNEISSGYHTLAYKAPTTPEGKTHGNAGMGDA